MSININHQFKIERNKLKKTLSNKTLMVKAIVIEQSGDNFREVDIVLPSKELNKSANKVIKNQLLKQYFQEIPNKKSAKGFTFVNLDENFNPKISISFESRGFGFVFLTWFFKGSNKISL